MDKQHVFSLCYVVNAFVCPVRPVPVKALCESIMRKRNRTSLLLLGLMWVSIAAWAEPQIRIERNQDEFRIDASLRVDAHHHIENGRAHV